MPEPDMPSMSWKEMHSRIVQNITNKETLAALACCQFDFGDVKLADLGTEYSGAKLISAVMDRHPQVIQLANGTEVRWESFEQHDMNAHRLTGGIAHPIFTIQKTIDKLKEKWTWCDGHIAVLEPILFSGRAHLKTGDGMANAECATLPPVECVGVLRSAPLHKNDDASALVILWYQTEFGIDQSALDLIKKLDWPALAYSWGY
jgi:hypothetical protein